MFMWPIHPPEDTEKVEFAYELMAKTFVAAWNDAPKTTSTPLLEQEEKSKVDIEQIKKDMLDYNEGESMAIDVNIVADLVNTYEQALTSLAAAKLALDISERNVAVSAGALAAMTEDRNL
jgi:hypothetical protein